VLAADTWIWYDLDPLSRIRPDMTSSYSTELVVLSIVIASAASYAALYLAGHVASVKARVGWLLAGACAMGTGIWSMHFIAMLAYRLPVSVGYDVPLVLLSLLIGIGASAIGLDVAGREKPSRGRIALAGPVMGLAIAGMHYTGMAALRLPATQHYDALLVVASVAVAVAASYAAIALFLRFRFDRSRRGVWLQVLSAVVMGHAVAGMHYTAMAAVHFQHGSGPNSGAFLPPDMLGKAIGAATAVILALAICGVMLDRWTRAQRAVRASEERFRVMVDALQDCAIFTVDPDGRVNSWNRGAERVLGFSTREIMGRHASLLFSPERRETADAELALARDKGFHETSSVCVTSRGELRDVVVTTTVMRDDGGTLLGFAHILRDVTEKRRAETELRRTEDRLRQAQKMEAIGQLAGGVAHDFNNMLTAIRGNAELLRFDCAPESEVGRGLLEITVAADRAASLTRQLLAFSRKQVLQPRAVNPNCIVAEMKGMLSRLMVGDVELRTELRADVGQVRVDPAQFEQVVLNLVVNARDAMKGAGRILIETANVELDADFCAMHPGLNAGPHVVLAVSDTGRGMTPEIQRQIFEPFFTTKELGAGTGLGLATVYGIVKQSDGYIEVKSELGVGSLFRIYLPRIGVNPPPPEAGAATLPRGAAEGTILVVEDEDGVRRLVQSVLERAGYRVLAAATASEGLKLLETHQAPLTLLVTDIMMPGTNGRQLSEHVTDTRPGTRVLFMSGYASEHVIKRGLLAPDMAFIQKPFTVSDFLEKVREASAAPMAEGVVSLT
jgi:PAS domain S-box-containing protein